MNQELINLLKGENLTNQEINILKKLDISSICYLQSLTSLELKKYIHLIIRLSNEKLPITIIKNNYFINLSKNEIQELLTYNKNKFKNYINLILSFKDRNLLNYDFKTIKTIMLMLFNNSNINSLELIQIFHKTNLILAPKVVDFTFKTLNLNEYYKAKSLKEIILKLPHPEKTNIMKIYYNIANTKNIYQADCLVSILTIKNIINYPQLSKIADLILNNPQATYLGYLEDILEDNLTLLEDNRLLNLCQYIINAKDDNQLDLLVTILKDKQLLKSNVLFQTLDIVSNLKNKIYYDYIYSLIERKQYLSNKSNSFDENIYNQILTNLLKTRSIYQMNSIISLVHIIQQKETFTHDNNEYEEVKIIPYFKDILNNSYYLDLTLK